MLEIYLSCLPTQLIKVGKFGFAIAFGVNFGGDQNDFLGSKPRSLNQYMHQTAPQCLPVTLSLSCEFID